VRFPDDVPLLTDGTVTLRPHTLADVPGIVEQCNDPVSVRWTTAPVPYDGSMARAWVCEGVPSGWACGRELGFAIEYDGRFAGCGRAAHAGRSPRGPR